MSILNLDDVPPPKTAAGSTGVAEPTGAVEPTGPASGASFDTSALTAPPSAAAGAAADEKPVQADALKTLELTPKIVEQLSTVYDPEIPVNIYELGLIYDVAVDPDGLAVIQMTLTAPGCPAAVTLPAEVQGKVKAIEGVSDARVDLVWEPPWTKDRMTEAAKLQLGIFD